METITTATAYSIGFPIIISLILLESIVSSVRRSNYYEASDTWGTLGLLAGNIGVSLAVQGLVLGFNFYLYQFRLVDVNMMLPSWAVWVLTFLMIDFTFYWYHRASHRVRLLWAVHMNHHSSVEMNFSVAFRQAWLGPISKVPFFAIIPLIGFDPSITIVAGVFATLWGVIGHTQWIGKLGYLDKVFNTPSTHRVHHGTNPEYIDTNYGNLFIFWDRIFGTYAEEKSPVRFGLVQNLETNNPITITFYTWRAIFKDIKQAKSYSEVIGYCFGPPDWRPTADK
jgi:sterol desaturase/sphingolipid hydroxylase (fatty acid hydroxylase superfamily)